MKELFRKIRYHIGKAGAYIVLKAIAMLSSKNDKEEINEMLRKGEYAISYNDFK